MGDGDHDHSDDGCEEDDDHDDGSGEASRYFHTMASRIDYDEVRNVLMMIGIFVRAIMVRWVGR